MHQALDIGGRLGRYYAILQATGDRHGTGVGITPSPPPAQSMVQQRIQTPSREEHGPGRRFCLSKGCECAPSNRVLSGH
jgi:hypothetical protein